MMLTVGVWEEQEVDLGEGNTRTVTSQCEDNAGFTLIMKRMKKSRKNNELKMLILLLTLEGVGSRFQGVDLPGKNLSIHA